ncbi:LuxR family transcriptional regulator [Sporohalobacter salinus]|uniref:LuxR family transcriptional regulator n=1 Tax=Sporohalobacter salinus TaxID=1494606 RepID=UPI00195F4AF1|nr:helix-turn-helix transcriptional regulator [Sporohalobacter salinus]MBM7624544.1 transcriptional regulator of acetoin/glycerol metabolism [Sporohalobacter salinus]
MERFQLNKEDVLLSWGRCTEKEISRDIFRPKVADEEELEKKLDRNQLLISVFKHVVREITCFLDGNYFFLLVDKEGVLLEIESSGEIKEQVIKSKLQLGIYFTEESSGTNANAMAMNLKKPVLVLPEQHYCKLFHKLYCFALPLSVEDKVIGYLDISTIGEKLQKELMVITNLLEEKIASDYKLVWEQELQKKNEVQLTGKQLEILKLFGSGLIEKEVADRMSCTESNIKYHKKNIFTTLDVTCSREAILKAIKLGLIKLEEIDV